MAIRPLEDRVLVKPIESESKTASGIYLPEAAKEKPVRGRVVATLPIGDGVDGVVYDSRRGLVISSNGEGTLTVVKAPPTGAFTMAETDTTERGARTIALDDSTGTLYLPTADFGPPPSPTPDRPHPRPSIVPDTFRLLVYAP